MVSSNPRMEVRVELSCGCRHVTESRYQDPTPEIGDHRRCLEHGDQEVNRWWRRSR